MFFHKAFRCHWVRQWEVRFLASNWVIEIRISPHVGQVAADETQEEDGSNRTANVFMRQFTLLTPNPLRQTKL